MWNILEKPDPLISDFRATSYVKAFLLNSIIMALIAVVAYESHNLLEKYVTKMNEISRVAISFASAFITAMLAYFSMYFLFGFGGGMLAAPLTPVSN